ncbi:hypothetical protein ACLMJK_003855 [Lecanora helva]
MSLTIEQLLLSFTVVRHIIQLVINAGKRVNHSTEMVKHMINLGERMNKIEGALSRWANVNEPNLSAAVSAFNSGDTAISLVSSPSLRSSPCLSTVRGNGEELAPNSAIGPEQRARHPVLGDGNPQVDFASNSFNSIWADILSCTEKLLLVDQRSKEIKQGSDFITSPMHDSTYESSFAKIDASILIALQDTRKVLQATSRGRRQPKNAQAGFSITLPPRADLEGCLDPYITEVNQVLPVFAQADLMEASRDQYGAQIKSTDLAWAASFNCITLQIMTTKSSIESDLAESQRHQSLKAGLIRNVQCCYRNLDRFLESKISNVQALLLMALTALSSFDHSTFDVLFALTCNIAKAVGLHRQSSLVDKQDGNDAERINLFWTLFIIDKCLALKCRRSCHLQSFDCDVPLPLAGAEDDVGQRDKWVAAIRLAFINENIYRDLYSAKSDRMSETRREEKVDVIMRKLDDWVSKHQHHWDEKATSPDMYGRELRQAILTSRIMTTRRSQNKIYQAQQISYARQSLLILKHLATPPTSIASALALERVLLYHAPVAFSVMYQVVTEGVYSALEDDISLLVQITSLINSCPSSSSTSYISKLQAATSLCSRVCARISAVRGLGNSFPNTFTFPPFPDLTDLDSSPHRKDINALLHSSTPVETPYQIEVSSGSISRCSSTKPDATQGTNRQYNHGSSIDYTPPWYSIPEPTFDEDFFNNMAVSDLTSSSMGFGTEGYEKEKLGDNFDQRSGDFMTMTSTDGQQPITMETDTEDSKFFGQPDFSDFTF